MADGIGHRDAGAGAEASGPDSANGMPPASTLAAQLVENLSSSTRFSRNDENRELDGFLSTIQRVADDPELLKTTTDRIEHNHMISYVYTRAALDGIKLDDPILDPKRLRNDAFKAINFLRFSIKETPSLLTFRVSDGDFLFRGQEPLWAWLVPRLLRLLGHDKCLDLQGSIEGFIQYLQLTAARHGSLWEFAASLAQYLRAILAGKVVSTSTSVPTLIVTALLDHLQSPSTSLTSKSTPSIVLPPEFALGLALGDTVHYSSQHAFYTLSQTTQVFRQAISICTILAYPLISSDAVFNSHAAFSEDLLTLLDAWLDILQVHKRWTNNAMTRPQVPIMTILVALILRHDLALDGNTILLEKSCVLLVLCCSELALRPEALLDESADGAEAREVYCRALIVLSSVVQRSETIKRFVASKLAHELETLIGRSSLDMDDTPARCDNHVGTGTDIWVRHQSSFFSLLMANEDRNLHLCYTWLWGNHKMKSKTPRSSSTTAHSINTVLL